MVSKPRSVTPKVRAILIGLEKLIKTHAEASNMRLPTAKTMADSLAVSPVTLFKALEILRERGVITLSPKRGIQINCKAVNSTFDLAAAQRLATVERSTAGRPTLEQQILHDIFVGEFSSFDSLPQIKELLSRYQVRFETLKSALAALTEKGVLRLRKRRFVVAARKTFRHRSRIVVFTRDTSRAIAEYTPRSAQFWRLLEAECVARGILLDLRSLSDALRERPGTAGESEPGSPYDADVLGYVLLTVNTSFTELHDLLVHVHATFRPAAVLDEVGAVTIPSIALDSLSMRLFVMSTTASAGTIAGNYLLNHNHRKAAYFSVFSSAEWSVNRFRGLEEAFAEAGIAQGVRLFGRALTDEWTAMLDPMPDSAPYAALAPLLAGIQRTMNPNGVVDERVLYREWFSTLWQMRIEAVLAPLFEQALADRTITAWVADNDDTGLAALKYLNTHRIRVPEEVSLIGFDDTTKALTAGLTSFDFNVPAVVHAVMNHLLFTSASRRLIKRGPVEIPGIIMERKTSGPAKASANHSSRRQPRSSAGSSMVIE